MNQIIREEYYDEEGKLVLLPQGYAVTEKEYDANGNPVFTSWDGKRVPYPD